MNEDFIDAGDLRGNVFVPWNEKKHRSETARSLAKFLMWTMVGTGLLQLSFTAWMIQTNNQKGIETVSAIFNSWLPIISGLVGSSVTYYFTRENAVSIAG